MQALSVGVRPGSRMSANKKVTIIYGNRKGNTQQQV